MVIPDCREDAVYNEDFLNDFDARFIRGFDYCAEAAADAAFDNLETLLSNHPNGRLMEVLNTEIPEQNHEEYEYETIEGIAVKREVRTYGDYLRSMLLDWIESKRDEIITSMIDAMDDDEYQELKAAAMARNEAKAEPKEYHNTRLMY